MLTMDEDHKKSKIENTEKKTTQTQLEGVESEWLEWAARHTARKWYTRNAEELEIW